MNMIKLTRFSRSTLLAFGLAVAIGGQAVSAAAAFRILKDPVYATVAGKVLTVGDYRIAVRSAVRQKFYHGKIPAGRLESVRREAGKDLITRTLLLQEAQRRGVTPDQRQVQETADKYEQRYRGNAEWKKRRAEFMPRLLRYLREQNTLRKLDQAVRHVPPPTEAQLRAYYRGHMDKFTEPAQFRLSVILLGVDASAPPKTWDAARSEAAALFKRLQAGADFAAAARLHSADRSAARGGDMGYLHKGMLAQPVQKVVDTMQPGQISAPVTLLRGVAIFRLDDIRPAKRNDYQTVRTRARGLWLREQGQRAWQALVDRLWQTSAIVVNEKYTPSFVAENTGPGAGKTPPTGK